MYGSNGDGPKYDNDKRKVLLQVTELANTLETYQADTQANKLGLFGFDECVMANVETVAELYPYAHYIISSQESVMGNGFDYYTPLSKQTPLQSRKCISDGLSKPYTTPKCIFDWIIRIPISQNPVKFPLMP